MPDERSTVLIVKSPPCAWLGSGHKALVAEGGTNVHHFDSLIPDEHGRQLTGVFTQLRVGSARDACQFVVAGDMTAGCKLYRASDRRQWIENDHSCREAGTPLLLWGCIEHEDWAKEWVFSSDGTLSPAWNPHEVCFGVETDGRILLVPRSDTKRRLVFGGGPEMEDYFRDLREEAATRESIRQVMDAEALAKLTPAWCAQLRSDGFAKLESMVPRDVVDTARGEINRLLGRGDQSTDAFKGKISPSHPAITALIRSSAVPLVLAELLGGDREWYVERAGAGQVALRFPGDMCPEGSSLGPAAKISPGHFDGVRKAWHIDGCPSDFNPGVSDHYGTIHNFDVLVGILLSDVPNAMSGELVVYPGSPTALAGHFGSDRSILERLRTEGHTALPNGEVTDGLFSRPVAHCLGRAGDVFLANYMTAHLIAPNASPDIRYAVYFRLSGPRFEERIQEGGGNVHSMLRPWHNWEGLNRRLGEAAGDVDEHGEGADAELVEQPGLHRQRSSSLEQERRQKEMQRQLASADYEHLQRHPGNHASQVDGAHQRDQAHETGSSDSVGALASMFPEVEKETVMDVLASCRGNAERAAEHLLEIAAAAPSVRS